MDEDKRAKLLLELTQSYLEACEELNMPAIVLMLGNEDRSLLFHGNQARYVETAPLEDAFRKLGIRIIDNTKDYGDSDAN